MGKKLKRNKIGEMMSSYQPRRAMIVSVELIPEPEVGGFTVYCPELDIYSQGDSEEEALKNIKEAAELHIQEVGINKLELRKVIRKELEMVI